MGRLTALVLGLAAGGGFPQWNCRCPTCRLAWAGDARVRPRTQASLAVTADGENWLLINASPDLPQQVRQSKALHPRNGTRGNDVVTRMAVVPGAPLMLPGGLQAQLFTVPGKLPLYLEGEHPEIASETAANVGVEIYAGNARMIYIPGAAAVTAAMTKRIKGADVVFFDGTLFRDDEMIMSGTGAKTGRRMGHMPIDGEDGSLAALEGVAGRRVYVHINNTNPILVAGSPERLHVERKGWEVAEDGMEIVL
jgi:pyrroloquinoline quinone biosynthesis protein B